MDFFSKYDEPYKEYCDKHKPEQKCFLSSYELITKSNTSESICFCSAPISMDTIHLWETIYHLQHILCTILVMVLWYSLSRLVTQLFPCLNRFTSEFLIIIIPTIISINIANKLVEYICLAGIIFAAILVWKKECLKKAKCREFGWGKRSYILTLIRSVLNLQTSICILAIDFESFPKEFRKSRGYGVALMDVGIGLFVVTMGLVSRRMKKLSDLYRLMQTILPLLCLGILRTSVIIYIDYPQDEHEYGVHMNAFFILAFTKFFGTIISYLALSDNQLLPLGLIIVLAHEFALQNGLSDYVMTHEAGRDNLWDANREGLVSLPGFVALFLISVYVGKWIKTGGSLIFEELFHKLKTFTLISMYLWLLVMWCVSTIGIARVTCNLGYVIWQFAITFTIIVLFVIFFDLVLNTLYPVNPLIGQVAGGDIGDSDRNKYVIKSQNAQHFVIPSIVEAINLNGLLFFLLANVLTGGVNIFLSPGKRSDSASIFILIVYMLIDVSFVYVLYKLKIRIA